MNLPARLERHTIVPAHSVRPRAGVLSVFSGQVRRGPWEMPQHLRLAAVMGSVEVDLREALIPEGDSEIEVFCLFGSVELVLPPGVIIEFDGDAFAGSFEFTPDSMYAPPVGAPRIRVTGSATFGSVECEVRIAGESASEAKRRRKRPEKWLQSGL
jgi:formylmethanofuran dehydrogenase subunit D